jgi:hypothetical protein
MTDAFKFQLFKLALAAGSVTAAVVGGRRS